jgi:hypothetical protein
MVCKLSLHAGTEEGNQIDRADARPGGNTKILERGLAMQKPSRRNRREPERRGENGERPERSGTSRGRTKKQAVKPKEQGIERDSEPCGKEKSQRKKKKKSEKGISHAHTLHDG